MFGRTFQKRTTLTEAEAKIVKGMLARGDKQHHIATYFGVNAGRVAEIATGQRYAFVPAQRRGLPPPGPYSVQQVIEHERALLEDLRGKLIAGRRRDALRLISAVLAEDE